MVADCKSLDDYINRYQIDGIDWKAQKLLATLNETDIRRNDNVEIIARTISMIPQDVRRDAYAKKIAKEYNIVLKTMLKLVENHAAINRKKDESRKIVRKNKVQKLEGDPATFPFFLEQVTVNKKTNDETFKGIKIDKYKFVQLLGHFGFTRYGTGDDQSGKDGYTFVRLKDNVINSVTRDEIIDYVENFVKNEYNFDECDHTDAELLINTFYDQIRTIFSKDLFARVRTDQPIIINRDTKDSTFLYYKNGFVEITKDGWKLRSYDEMEGSVWEHQMLDRNFTLMDVTFYEDSSGNIVGSKPDEKNKAQSIMEAGYFADYCLKLANDDKTRFQSLCSLIGFLMHDFYEYKLKAVLFTDSSISETSEGRTGKTMLARMVGNVRSYTEINGKQFDANDINKYQAANLGTQVLHLNDVKHNGRNRFDFEDIFNDITEGYIVKKLYMPIFRQLSKMIISSNKTLNIRGASQRDRIMEFEVSPFFGEHRYPDKYYGCWFPEPNGSRKDWNDEEFNRFDNFMCFCAQMFHANGFIEPGTINLGLRKLINHTKPEFVEFMDEIATELKRSGEPWIGYSDAFSKTPCMITEFEFDLKKLKDRFLHDNEDYKKWLEQRKFNDWMKLYAEHKFGIKKPMMRKSNGVQMFKFEEEAKQ
jgi:hypothetical protein